MLYAYASHKDAYQPAHPHISFVVGCLNSIIMPPTLKKLMGHIAFGASVSGCVRHTFCTYCDFKPLKLES